MTTYDRQRQRLAAYSARKALRQSNLRPLGTISTISNSIRNCRVNSPASKIFPWEEIYIMGPGDKEEHEK